MYFNHNSSWTQRQTLIHELIESTLNQPAGSKKIILKSSFGKTDQKLHCQPVRIGRSDRFYGVPFTIEEKELYKKIYGYEFSIEHAVETLEEGYTFDLHKTDHIAKAYWALMNDSIALDNDELKYGKKYFYVYNPKEAESSKIQTIKKRKKASDTVESLTPEEMLYYGVMLDLPARSISNEQLYILLNDKAVMEPDKILAVANDPDKPIRMLLDNLVQYRIIVIRDGYYMLPDGTPVAPSEEAVISYLKMPQNADQVNALRKALESKLVVSKQDALNAVGKQLEKAKPKKPTSIDDVI